MLRLGQVALVPELKSGRVITWVQIYYYLRNLSVNFTSPKNENS